MLSASFVAGGVRMSELVIILEGGKTCITISVREKDG